MSSVALKSLFFWVGQRGEALLTLNRTEQKMSCTGYPSGKFVEAF